MASKHEKCHCIHHKISPVLVFLIGLTFLLANLEVLSQDYSKIVWPVLIMLIGAIKGLSQAFCRCCSKD